MFQGNTCLENLEMSGNLSSLKEVAKGEGSVVEKNLCRNTIRCRLYVWGYIDV